MAADDHVRQIFFYFLFSLFSLFVIIRISNKVVNMIRAVLYKGDILHGDDVESAEEYDRDQPSSGLSR
uniref:Bestrophin homolog n=1 Tax=Steinernema glaseri TaxID=37863 RepID=A0A1I7YFX0_9BILA